MDRLSTRVLFLLVAVVCAGYTTGLWLLGGLLVFFVLPVLLVQALTTLAFGQLFLGIGLSLCGVALLSFWKLALAYVGHGREGLRQQPRRWWRWSGYGVVYCTLVLLLILTGRGSDVMDPPAWAVFGLPGIPVLIPMVWLYLCRRPGDRGRSTAGPALFTPP